MTINKGQFLSATAIALLFSVMPSFAQTTLQETTTTASPDSSTVRKTTTIQQDGKMTSRVDLQSENHSTLNDNVTKIKFLDFDINQDGVMSLDEIGRMLFKLYDGDGNEVLDNKEYERRNVLSVIPMEKNTVITYDFDGDGVADKTEYTFDNFMQETVLTKFDANKDGLSPHEFSDRSFMESDINNDKVIDLKEWQGSYIASIDIANKAKSQANK